jgi:molybdopterin synthase sulfur carrier subunit
MSYKKIHICYFALLRDEAGVQEQIYETQSQTLGELYNELKQKYDFSLLLENIQVALNDEYTSIESEFQSGDKIVFIPPVAGG